MVQEASPESGEAGKRVGHQAPTGIRAFAFCQPDLFSVSFYQAGSLWPG